METERTSTIPATVVNIVKTIIGAGILGLPYAYGQTGQLLGTVLLLLTAFAQAFALHLLSLCVTEAHARGEMYPSYRSLANDAFGGSAVANVLVEACVGLGCFGFGTSYLVVIGGLCPQIAYYCGGGGLHLLGRPLFWITALGCGVGLPLFCVRRLDSLKVSSMVGNAGVVFIVVVCCVFAAGGLAAPEPEQAASFFFPPRTRYTSLAGSFEVLSIYVFAFSCAQNMPGFVNELRDPTIHRVDLSIALGVTFCLGMYLLTAVCSALAFGASVDPNLLVSFPQQHHTMEGAVATVARVAVVVNVCGSFPLFMHPTRASVSQILFRKTPNELPFCLWAALTAGIFGLSWGIGVTVQSLDTIMAFVGGTSGILIGFAFPGIFYYRLHRRRPSAAAGADLALRSYGPEAEHGSPGAPGPSASAGPCPKGTGITAGAWLLGAVSTLLIPVLLTAQIVKMTS